MEYYLHFKPQSEFLMRRLKTRFNQHDKKPLIILSKYKLVNNECLLHVDVLFTYDE